VIIDAHLHLWDIRRHRYEWLRRPSSAALNRTFGFADFQAAAGAVPGPPVPDRAVLVQADDDDADTEAMFEIADSRDEIAGVVAYAPLDRPAAAAARLDELAARPKFAGIRTLIHDQPDPDWLLRPDVADGLSLLEERDVPFDIVAVLPRHLEHVPVLSARYPRLRMVLDHLAHPPLESPGQTPWRSLITEAARNPLVHAKVSGLYPPDADVIRPFVEFAAGLFGPGRLMFGSDWPVSELAGGYARTWAELSRVLGELPAADREEILAGTARRYYRLP
jgi:L-fuconolactonase